MACADAHDRPSAGVQPASDGDGDGRRRACGGARAAVPGVALLRRHGWRRGPVRPLSCRRRPVRPGKSAARSITAALLATLRATRHAAPLCPVFLLPPLCALRVAAVLRTRRRAATRRRGQRARLAGECTRVCAGAPVATPPHARQSASARRSTPSHGGGDPARLSTGRASDTPAPQLLSAPCIDLPRRASARCACAPQLRRWLPPPTCIPARLTPRARASVLKAGIMMRPLPGGGPFFCPSFIPRSA